MFRLAINKGVAVTVATLVVAVLGVVSVFRVPVQMIPDMDLTTITVVTTWPGASPQDIEREILIEQEEYLRSIPKLVKMTSEASTGEASIELEFSLGTDINQVLIRTNNSLSQVPDYPENVDEPRILTSAFSDNWFMFFIVKPLPGNPENIDIKMERDFVEDYVKTAFERSPGVSEVRVTGGVNRQVRIYVDPAKLAERQITISELRRALRTRNQDVSGGDLDSGKRRYLVRTMGRFNNVKDIEDAIIAMRNGTPVYLRDVGYAVMAHSEQRSESRFEGEEGMMIWIKRQRGENVIEVMEHVMETAERLKTTMSARGLRMDFFHSDVIYIQEAVAVVGQNLALGGVLALIVLFLFLRSYSYTLIGAMGIPLCTIAAFLGLLIMGRTINVISLAGVAFAIGMTLDNSIVVLENIHRHLQMGKTAFDAALDGVKEVWTAVFASTLTTVLVFLPLILIKEEAGQLYSDIAIAISAAIILSMLVAITLIPSAAARFPQKTRPSTTSGYLSTQGAKVHEKIMRFVEWLMPSILRRLMLIGGVLAVTVVVIIVLTPKAEYLPEGEEPVTFSMMFPPPGYNLQSMIEISREVEDYFVPHVGEGVSLFAEGKSEVPSLRWIMNDASASSLFLISGTTSPRDIDAMIDIVTGKFSEFPGMISFSARGSIFSGNEGGTRSLDLDITGPELVPLFRVGRQAFLRAGEVLNNPQIKPSPSSLNMGQPLLEIRPDWDRAAELGISTDNLGYLVWALSDGAYHDDFYLGDEKIDMYIYSTTGTVKGPSDLQNLPIYSNSGGIVPLSSIATVQQTVNTEIIRRVNGERTITLSIVSPRDVPLEEAVEIVQRDVIGELYKAGIVPDNVDLRLAGASDKLLATRAAISENLILAIILSYLLMVAIFSHWGFPFIIMLTAPLGIGGGIFGLWFMNLIPGINQPFDMITILGFLVLIGVVVNNPILLVEQARANIRNGMETVEAVIESTRVRTRPILMTTMTTLGGLSPLVFIPRAGTELYRGLGIIVLFGLMFSTMITLTFTPSLLSLLLQFRAWLANRHEQGVAAE